VFTLWRLRAPAHTLWIFQSEGGDVTQEAADEYFRLLEHVVAATPEPFATLYDMSRPLGHFLPFAMQLARVAGRVRETMLPVRTVVVCLSPTARNVMRLIIGIIGGRSPWVIVDSAEKGYLAAMAPARDDEQALSDDYEGTSLTEGLDPVATARGLQSAAMVGSSA
jgi:hypothetical protein